MPRSIDSELAEQYSNSARLAARQKIYRFATGNTSWHRWIFEQFDLPADAPVRILELGCGNAELWRQNLDRIPPSWDITISDLSPGMLRDAMRGLSDRGDRFHIARIDAQRIPFESGRFDLVIANHMLYHVPDRARACREIRRVLRPGGRFLAATNGQAHMLELRSLIDRYVPHTGFPTLNFTLEGGQAELEQFFERVEVHRLRGDLRITEAQAVVDYVRSLISDGADREQGLGQLRTDVEHHIQRDGAFIASTETGLFCCTFEADRPMT